MRWKKPIVSLWLLEIVVGLAYPAQMPRSQVPQSLFKDAQVEKLIDQLAKAKTWMTGTHPTAWTSQFMAIEEEPEFHGGILGSERPTVNPVAKKLVQMGIRALPSLITHLNDSRQTKLVFNLGDNYIMSAWFATEYEPRSSDPKLQSDAVAKVQKDRTPIFGREEHISDSYTFTVGDICYVLIGQIVNRSYSALRYQPTSCAVLNSPTHSPDLRDAVVADWSNLTKTDHLKLLLQDAYESEYSVSSAVKRLMYYYPGEGQKAAVRLLNRPFYDSWALWKLESKMVKEHNQDRLRTLLAQATSRFGTEASKKLPVCLAQDYHEDKEVSHVRNVIKLLFPKFNQYHPGFINVADIDDQTQIVQALATFPNRQIDAAVFRLYKRACSISYKDKSKDDARSRKQMILELKRQCMLRLSNKAACAEYQKAAKEFLKSAGK